MYHNTYYDLPKKTFLYLISLASIQTDIMLYREATINDIEQLHSIRMGVRENKLINPLLVTEANYINFLTVLGKGWLCEINNVIAGFAIIDLKRNNVWALFIRPGYEKKGIGRTLHD